MKLIWALFMTMRIVKCEIEILEPEALRESVKHGGKAEPLIEYSVSMFGEIIYNKNFVIQILFPGDENRNGCDDLKAPAIGGSIKYVWLLERGGCTYSKKAYSSQQSGAMAAFVYHEDPAVQVNTLIPCGDSVCILNR
jgi:hypothetical protein